MNESTHPPNPDAPKGFAAWGWRCVFIGLYLLLVFSLYHQEGRLLAKITAETDTRLLDAVQNFLMTRTWPFLPGHAWRLVVPFSVIGLGLLLPFRWRWPFFGGCGALLTLLLLADRVYFDFFSAIISLDSFKAAHQLWDVRTSLRAVFAFSDVLLLLLYVLIGSTGWLAAKFKVPHLSSRFAPWLDRSMAVLFFVLAYHCGKVAFFFPSIQEHAEAKAHTEQPGQAEVAFVLSFFSSQRDFATFFGLFNFHLHDVWNAIKAPFERVEVTAEDLKVVDLLLQEKKDLNDLDSPLRGSARGRNLILISLESFQHFLLDLEVEGEEVTPTLNGLARQALRWDYIFDNVGKGGTSDAEFMVMTGLMPDAVRMASMSTPAQNTLLALPAQLRKGGYHTVSLHGNDPSFWNRHTNHPIYGIDEMIFKSAFSGERLGMGVPDQVFFEEGAEFLTKMESPFFAFLISLSSHHPYAKVPESHRDWTLGFPKDAMITKYFQLARYVDDCLASFIEQMKRDGLWENSVIFLYGDHISPLDPKSKELALKKLGIDLNSNRAFRIPFLVLIPGQETLIQEHRDGIADHVGGLQDLFPTALHLLGMEIPYGIYGTHLFISNQEKGPMPYFRQSGTFIDQGILYTYAGRITDRDGLVFMPRYDLPKLSQAQIRKNLHKIDAEKALHRLIFDADVQIKAIRAREDLSEK